MRLPAQRASENHTRPSRTLPASTPETAAIAGAPRPSISTWRRSSTALAANPNAAAANAWPSRMSANKAYGRTARKKSNTNRPQNETWKPAKRSGPAKRRAARAATLLSMCPMEEVGIRITIGDFAARRQPRTRAARTHDERRRIARRGGVCWPENPNCRSKLADKRDHDYMRWLPAAAALLLTLALAACDSPATTRDEQAALAAAERWLALSDSGDHAAAWNLSSNYFRML